jgi:hypothetical protein
MKSIFCHVGLPIFFNTDVSKKINKVRILFKIGVQTPIIPTESKLK